MGTALFMHGNAHAIVSTFTNQADWEAALAGAAFLTEDFDGPASSFASNSTGNPLGPVTVDLEGNGEGPPDNPGLTGTGFFLVELDSDDQETSDGLELQFNRPNMLGVAFLGLQDEGGTNLTLDLEEIGFDFGTGGVPGFEFLACEVLSLCTPAPPTDVVDTLTEGVIPFIGFVFDAPRDDFELNHGDAIRNLTVDGDSEDFLIDRLIVAEAATAVPEPGAVALLGVGLIGLIWTRRRRRAG